MKPPRKFLMENNPKDPRGPG